MLFRRPTWRLGRQLPAFWVRGLAGSAAAAPAGQAGAGGGVGGATEEEHMEFPGGKVRKNAGLAGGRRRAATARWPPLPKTSGSGPKFCRWAPHAPRAAQVPFTSELHFRGGQFSPPQPISCYRTLDSGGRSVEVCAAAAQKGPRPAGQPRPPAWPAAPSPLSRVAACAWQRARATRRRCNAGCATAPAA